MFEKNYAEGYVVDSRSIEAHMTYAALRAGEVG